MEDEEDLQSLASNAVSLLSQVLADIDNYEQRKLGRDEVDGLEVSTAYTSDCGYETAVLDEDGVHPVERYGSREEAEAGHKKWLGKVVGLKEVTKLGYLSYVPDKVINLKRSTIKREEE